MTFKNSIHVNFLNLDNDSYGEARPKTAQSNNPTQKRPPRIQRKSVPFFQSPRKKTISENSQNNGQRSNQKPEMSESIKPRFC